MQLKRETVKAGDSDQPNWDSEEHAEITETYDFLSS